MDIKILGAHNTESKSTRMNCILINNEIALDAGGLTSSLSLKAQLKLKAICLTHGHYDHVRDIPALGMNLYLNGGNLDICTTKAVFETLTAYLLNDDLYPNWFKRSVFNFVQMEYYQPQMVKEYVLTAIPVNHSVPPAGYQVVDNSGKAVFYTGDTGADLSECWSRVSPQLLIIEVTAPNRFEESIGKGAKHLTPRLLKQELTNFKTIKGYIPEVLIVHMNPPLEEEIKSELTTVATSLNCRITLSFEGMKIKLS